MGARERCVKPYFAEGARVLYSRAMKGSFVEVYTLLRGAYGPQRWWPVTPPGGMRPAYTGGPRNGRQRF